MITIDSAIETGKVEVFVPQNSQEPIRIVSDSRADSTSKPFDELFFGGHYAEAVIVAERELERIRRSIVASHSTILDAAALDATDPRIRKLVESLHHVAIASLRSGNYTRAESVMNEAIPLCELAPSAYAETLIGLIHDLNYARYVHQCTDEESILELGYELNRAKQRSMELLGSDHPETARLMTSQARLLISEFSYQEAEKLLVDALRIRTNALGTGHRDVSESLLELARLNAFREDNDEADGLFRQVLAIREAECGPNHPDVAEVLFHYSDFFMYNRRDTGRAGPLLRRALDIWSETSGLDHPMVARESNYIRKVLAAGDSPTAETMK